MKKRIACALAAMIAASCFSGCAPFENFGETFEGVLSESVYREQAAALTAFCSAELGENVSSTYETERKLTEKEAQEAGISVPTGEKFVAAEMGKVRIDGGEASLGTLQTDNGYRYYTPAPAKGERLSSSYLNSVFDESKYTNCTAETTYSFRYSSIASNYYSVYEYTEDVVHFKQTLPGLLGLDAYFRNGNDGMETAIRRSDTEPYGDIPSGMELYMKSGGEKRNIKSFTDINELLQFIFSLKFDARYLEKTANGFQLPSENYKQLVFSLSSLTPDAMDEFNQVWDESAMYAHAQWYVSEGRLSRVAITMNLLINENILSVSTDCTYAKFGTTELTFPRGAEA